MNDYAEKKYRRKTVEESRAMAAPESLESKKNFRLALQRRCTEARRMAKQGIKK